MSDTAPTTGTYGHSSYRVGEPLPLVLVLEDLAVILGVGKSRAYQLEHDGELAHLECLPRVGKRRRYSGKKVQAWVDGDGAEESTSRYFQAGRKAGRR
jgi:hypothetical protein